ncbi:putative sh3 domain-containing protein [Zalerion maritima]|uniref:Sh3 domain-containing protein n=1 Tax=Zalerion maritima TaxID=339359 RepID=A0AAD5RJS6_9PEZI|nr:putative sh3 domain-containing protein [Zalerion maritima]
MPWQPLPRIAFAVATYPFAASEPADLVLEIGDELYVIEETPDGQWLRGYLVAPPSLLSGLTSTKGQTLEARVFSGIFPRSCVEIREVLGDADFEDEDNDDARDAQDGPESRRTDGDSGKGGLAPADMKRKKHQKIRSGSPKRRKDLTVSSSQLGRLSVPVKRDPKAPRPPAPVPLLKIGDETPTSEDEPLIDEIASCLREWHSTNLHELLLSRKYSKLERLSQLVSTLNFARQQFLHNVLTAHEYSQLREKTVWDLVRVNKLCDGEVIVRDPSERGRVLTGNDSVVELTKLQSIMSLLHEPPHPSVELTALHHLLVDVRAFAGASSEDTTLVMHLVTKEPGGQLQALSENYIVHVPGGTMGTLGRHAQIRTLFTDLLSTDIGDGPAATADLYLVVKIRASQEVVAGKPLSRSGSMAISKPFSSHREDKTPASSGGKSMRRSLMWSGKGARAAFSRGSSSHKLDSVTEHAEERPQTDRQASQDGPPPSTADSKKSRTNSEQMPPPQMMADRTVGAGALKLNNVMKQGEEVEHVVSIWSPSARYPTQEYGDDWDDFVKEIIDSETGHYEKSRRAERLQVHLRPFNNPDADALIKATPTMLSGICRTNKMGFSGAPTKPRSDIYLTMDEAAMARQTLLSRFGGSATSLPSITGNNLQLTLEVRKSTGERIENCIFASSNSEGLSNWKSTATGRGETWGQTIRLSLLPQDVATAHVVMFLADTPYPPFAVAHMPLWDQHAFMRDGPHALLLYKIDENTAMAQTVRDGRKGGYLSLKWSATGNDPHSAEVTGPLATIRLYTYLCSTRFSQDRVVLGLIKWKDCPRDELPAILKAIVFVPEIEIVKLLSDVLDALFGILVENSGKDDVEDLVFTALVTVLGIVHDRRFNLGPLVDQYAATKFNYPFATPCLVRSFTRLLSNPTEPETARKLRATLKVVRHILKFIAHARGQQKAKEAGIGITSSTPGFTRHLRSIFKALDLMMKNTAPVLVGSQTLAVQHFHTWLPELAGLLTTEEILHIAIDFMDSCASVKGKLVLYKLVLIINYAKLDIFSHPEQRSALSANTVRWIAPHWGHAEEVTDQWKEQVRLCCSVLATQVEHLGPEVPDYIPKIVDSYLAILSAPQKLKSRLSLLFPSQYPFPTKPITEEAPFDEALIELSAVLSALSNSPAGMQLELAEDDLTVLLENILRVHMSIMEGETFPADWLSVHIFHYKSTMRTLQYLSNIMLEAFLPDPDEAESFNTDLWKMFFATLLKLVGSPTLALETFPEQKRRAVWKIAGDVRESGADLLRQTWEAIGWETSTEERNRYGLTKMGGYQVQYVPTLVGPIVELCLSVHEGLRKMAVEVLQTMIVSEWTLSEDLVAVQTEMIDCLDLFFKSKPLTESILQKLFVGELLARFEPLSKLPDDPLYAAVVELASTVDEFLDLLVAVHSNEVSGEASDLIHRLRLMEFLRDMQKEEIFIRYVHQLATLQAECRNHAEAGLALRLHADLYDWDPTRNTQALADPELPAQSHFERKERIYFTMIKHFEDGEAWGSAISAYKELQQQYESNIFDFAKLARSERAIATIYETISKSERLVPKYFKVVFKGLGFHTSLRDKEFVYEGAPSERASAFTDRIQEQYPKAQIITSGDVEDEEGQYLVISALSPHRDLSHNVFQRARVPHPIRDFLISSTPQVFSVSSRRNTSGPVQEHYAEKILYETDEAFPTILRRSEIIKVSEIKLSAKETAIERIVRKTQEMATVEKRVAEGDDDISQLLLDAIKISVNAESETGVSQYRSLITESGEDEDEVELDPQENAIRMALVDHAIMLKRCLATFAKSNNDILRQHHEDLHHMFEETFAPEIAVFMPPQPSRETPALAATPSPTWRRPTPTMIPTPPKAQQNGVSITEIATEEAAVKAVRPISVRQGRGARLSFLGGKKQQHQQQHETPTSDVAHTNGHVEHSPDSDSATGNRRRSQSKDNNHRRSFFRTHTSDTARTGRSDKTNGTTTDDWAKETEERLTERLARTSIDTGATLEKKDSVGVASLDAVGGAVKRGTGSVRKRLSMLKLGKKTSKGSGLMGSVDEE